MTDEQLRLEIERRPVRTEWQGVRRRERDVQETRIPISINEIIAQALTQTCVEMSVSLQTDLES